MSEDFDIRNISKKKYLENHHFANGMFKAGAEPTFFTNDDDYVTAGYGRRTDNGYFEYPLWVNQATGKVEVESTIEA